MNIIEYRNEIRKLQREIGEFIKKSGDDLDCVEYDPENPDERFMRDEYRILFANLERIHKGFDYLNRPVKSTGILRKNEQNRYEIEDGHYFTSGEVVEIYRDGEWHKTRIEYSHNQEDYYAVGFGESQKLEGMRARYR